jgi:hypothetical protein
MRRSICSSSMFCPFLLAAFPAAASQVISALYGFNCLSLMLR